MTAIKHIGIVLIIAMSLMTVLPTAAIAGSSSSSGGGSGDNIICSGGSATSLGGIVSSVISLIVYLGALAAVLGGAAFTMASAAKPGDSKYIERRNQSVKYGAGSVLVLYIAEAVVSELDSSLSFECVLPF